MSGVYRFKWDQMGLIFIYNLVNPIGSKFNLIQLEHIGLS